MEQICKNCKRFKRINPLSKFGNCEVIFKMSNIPTDASYRIAFEVESIPFNFVEGNVYVGEDFGCIHFKS